MLVIIVEIRTIFLVSIALSRISRHPRSKKAVSNTAFYIEICAVQNALIEIVLRVLGVKMFSILRRECISYKYRKSNNKAPELQKLESHLTQEYLHYIIVRALSIHDGYRNVIPRTKRDQKFRQLVESPEDCSVFLYEQRIDDVSSYSIEN
jgi:hypothetical protein